MRAPETSFPDHLYILCRFRFTYNVRHRLEARHQTADNHPQLLHPFDEGQEAHQPQHSEGRNGAAPNAGQRKAADHDHEVEGVEGAVFHVSEVTVRVVALFKEATSPRDGRD